MSAAEVMQRLFSECGILSMVFSIAIVWLAGQLAKERAARETDRASALATIERYSRAYENVIVSNAKFEGLLSGRRDSEARS